MHLRVKRISLAFLLRTPRFFTVDLYFSDLYYTSCLEGYFSLRTAMIVALPEFDSSLVQ